MPEKSQEIEPLEYRCAQGFRRRPATSPSEKLRATVGHMTLAQYMYCSASCTFSGASRALVACPNVGRSRASSVSGV